MAALALSLPASAAAVNTFVVNNTGDATDATPGDAVCATSTPGVCTLRAAIAEANATSNVGFDDQITFAIGLAGSAQTINVATALPAVTDAVVIDGLSQGGGSYTGVPLVTVNGPGTSTANGGFRFLVAGSNNSVIDGLVLEDFDIAIQGAAGSLHVEHNDIGITPAGVTGSPHANGIGIRTSGAADAIGNVSDPAQGNTISGNTGTAVDDNGTATTGIYGNRIGTTPDGTAARPNGGDGIHSVGGANIGSAQAPNVISGNGGNGVLVDSGAVADSFIVFNRIGTNAAGTAALGNTGAGIKLDGASVQVVNSNVIAGNAGGGLRVLTSGRVNQDIQDNKIGVGANGTTSIPNTGNGGVDLQTTDNYLGGSLPSAGNTVANNSPFGVRVLGPAATGDRIRGNAIFNNAGLGIDLGGDGVTPNDPAPDPDSGPNRRQNFPVVASAVASGGATAVKGTLTSTANRSFGIEIFSSPACDPSGFGEGKSFLGSTTVTTDGSGKATFSASRAALAPGTPVSATATDLTTRDTSELARCLTVTAPGVPDTTAPAWIGSPKANPRTFAVNPKGAAETPVSAAKKKKVKKGTTFRYTLSEAARVVFTVQRKGPGRKVGTKCKKPTKSNRKKKACTRYQLIGAFAQQASAGKNSKKFSGRIGKKKLAPGKYRATLLATDAAGNRSQARQVAFRVVR